MGELPSKASRLDNSSGRSQHDSKRTEPNSAINRALYASILGASEVPGNPETMPDRFFLPPQITGEFAKALSLTLKDDLEYGSISSTVSGQIVFPELVRGKKNKIVIENYDDSLPQSKIETELVKYHSHPCKKFLALFKDPKQVRSTPTGTLPSINDGVRDFKHSIADIADIIAFPNDAMMDFVVHSGGISLIARTDKAKQPRNSTWTKLKTRWELRRMLGSDEFNDNTTSNWIKVIEFLEEHGFAYYYGRPAASGLSVSLAVVPKDIRDYYLFGEHYDIVDSSLQLREVRPDTLAQGIEMHRVKITPAVKRKFLTNK